jgi:hypothetical protein
MTKLTLSVDEETVEQAKQLARANGTSVSRMFSEFVAALVRGGARRRHGPLTRKASGLVSLPEGKSYRDVVEDALLDKYGLGE